MDRVSARVYTDWIKSADRGQMQTEFLNSSMMLSRYAILGTPRKGLRARRPRGTQCVISGSAGFSGDSMSGSGSSARNARERIKAPWLKRLGESCPSRPRKLARSARDTRAKHRDYRLDLWRVARWPKAKRPKQGRERSKQLRPQQARLGS